MQISRETPIGLGSDTMRVGAYIPETLRGSATETTVLVSLHSAGCDECRKYVAQLSSIDDEFRVWEARLRVVSDKREASVVIADRYGQVFYSFRAEAGHELPSPAVIAEALKFLGTLCPE